MSDIYSYGIDVSEHNGNLDFSALPNRPDFVIVRAGYSLTQDRWSAAYIRCLDALDIPYGVYWYSYATTVAKALQEAQKCYDIIKNWNVRVGVWFDMEDEDHWKANHGNPDNATISAMCRAFCSFMHEKGYYSGIYASKSWFENRIFGCDDFDKWVAWWGINDGTKNTDASNMGTMQQYAAVGGMDYDCTFVALSIYDIHPDPNPMTIDDYAVEVWEGRYGTGEQRKQLLNATPYGYTAIQNMVNEYGKVAADVWRGKYGNGQTRVDRLIEAGWNPEYVQRVVNVYRR